jgi:hypothetical protein
MGSYGRRGVRRSQEPSWTAKKTVMAQRVDRTGASMNTFETTEIGFALTSSFKKLGPEYAVLLSRLAPAEKSELVRKLRDLNEPAAE